MRITEIDADGYEQVVRVADPATGLDAIIAIHDTTLGPALGGVRMRAYPSTADALDDVLRLAKGMTYKFALARGDHGGGKSVIIGSPEGKTPDLLRAFADAVRALDGRYVPGVDSGTTQDDLRAMEAAGAIASCTGDDPSPYTALGVHAGILAAVRHLDGSPELRGRRVVVQGVGHVGASLVRQLVSSGAEVVVADVDDRAVAAVAGSLPVAVVPVEDALTVACDVYAPCALGGVVDDDSLARLDARAVVGAANNVLADPRHGEELHGRGILYAPDFCANAGGIIFLGAEASGLPATEARRRVRRIGRTLEEIWEIAGREDRPPPEVAMAMAEQVLASRRGA
ncbi:leucine dehydrogenase [Nocardioides thalensis]|uniref:Leucine dehydrogenase n=1 Tax=Nocardioides thalensis TaxID=1914755 RepID=A0A853BZU5_9ACTN|nr:amino acid dehydrogenase [Nocardioides thalensis]NYI99652.1 leucine dehydrogenase [Nocardioides thalensis]